MEVFATIRFLTTALTAFLRRSSFSAEAHICHNCWRRQCGTYFALPLSTSIWRPDGGASWMDLNMSARRPASPLMRRSRFSRLLSEVREVKRSVIGAHEWVEAVHSGSEIPNYDTYYFATITSELGILVTLSVNRNLSGQYVDRFKEMIKTLHVYQR
jgi:hypothetical protein